MTLKEEVKEKYEFAFSQLKQDDENLKHWKTPEEFARFSIAKHYWFGVYMAYGDVLNSFQRETP